MKIRAFLKGDGKLWQIAWTAGDANNAFLTLPGPDGLVHSGQQLFGNFTPQPPSQTPNGFAALAVYDLPANGGNGDGIIDARDTISILCDCGSTPTMTASLSQTSCTPCQLWG